MRFSILGAFEIAEDNRPADIGGGKQRAVLAILLLRAGEIVSVDALVDALWGEQAPDQAENTVQVYVSRLRKVVGDRLITRKPGYMLVLREEDAFDLRSFARATAEARASEDIAERVRLLRDADALWRGGPLADFTFESWAQGEIDRLNELRLASVEDRFDAELSLGAGGELVADLEKLVAEQPLRERLRAQLMTALYRAGRQADALAVYQDARRALTEELGIDPSPALQQLEREILEQNDAVLTGVAAVETVREPERAIVIAARDPSCVRALIELAEPLARSDPRHELILCGLVGPWSPGDVRSATSSLRAHAEDLQRRGIAASAIAFTSDDPPADFARLAAEHPIDLLMFDALASTFEPAGDEGLAPVLARVQCDVAAVIGSAYVNDRTAPIVVPFGGRDHDWAALQFAAWVAKIRSAPLHLVGSAGDENMGTRDASRLLAAASLVVQRMARVVAEPVLVEAGDGVLGAIDGAGVVVIGLSDRWQSEGFGEMRTRIAAAARAPVVVLRRGDASTSLSARADQTRYSWSRSGPNLR